MMKVMENRFDRAMLCFNVNKCRFNYIIAMFMTFNYLKSSLARNFSIYERNEKRSCGRSRGRRAKAEQENCRAFNYHFTSFQCWFAIFVICLRRNVIEPDCRPLKGVFAFEGVGGRGKWQAGRDALLAWYSIWSVSGNVLFQLIRV